MKFAFRLIKQLFIFLAVCLPLQLIGIVILLPAVFLFRSDKLPFFLRWFDNADLYIGRDTSTYLAVLNSGIWNRYVWLAFRNPINYFDYKYLGYQWTGQEVYTLYNPAEDNIGDGTVGGFRHIEVDSGIYEYYLIKPYSIFGHNLCIRFRMGWKIKDKNNPAGSISQWCLTFNPVQPYTGQ